MARRQCPGEAKGYSGRRCGDSVIDNRSLDSNPRKWDGSQGKAPTAKVERNNSTLALLFAVLIVGLLLRYPSNPQFHEVASDGSYYPALAHFVVSYGRAPWTTNPVSYIGLFPYSEGAAVPLLVAQLEDLASIPESLTAFLATDVAALAGALGVFLCVIRATRSGTAGVLGAFAFLTAPILLRYSTEALVTRFFVTCWVPFILLTFLDGRRWGFLRSVLVTVPLLVLLATTHLSFVLVSAIGVGILLLGLIERTWNRVRSSATTRTPAAVVSRHYYAVFLAACATLVVVTTFAPVSYGSEGAGLSNYDIGVFQGGSLPAVIGNLLVSIAGGAGIIAVMLTLAAPKLWNLGMRPFTFATLAAVLFIFAVVGFRLYGRPIAAVVMSIGAGLGLVGLGQFRCVRLSPRVRRGVAAVVLVLVIITIPVSLTVTSRWASGDTYTVTGPIYSAFSYTSATTSGNLFCNEFPGDRFLTAYTGRVCSPDLPGSSLEMVPFITSTFSWASLRVQPMGISEILNSGSELSLYQVVDYNPHSAYFQLNNSTIASSAPLLAKYNVTYALEYRPTEGDMAIRWTVQSPVASPFLHSVHQQCYLIFQNEAYNVWNL